MNQKAKSILRAVVNHPFALCNHTAVEHIRWVEDRLKDLKKALGSELEPQEKAEKAE